MSFARSILPAGVRLARQPHLFRTLATQVPFPTSSSNPSSSSDPSSSRLPESPAEHVENSASVASGEEGESYPSNVIFEDGDLNITDDVLRMLNAEATQRLPVGPIEYLPISSLASKTPLLPAPSGLAVPLPPKVFQQPLRKDILHRCTVYYLANLRQGSGSTKTRSEVNYSGKKLHRQKGTGRARVGDAGSGTRRGGGTIHGPHPRSFAQLLPRKVRQLGLHVALSSKLNSGLLRIVAELGEGNWSGTGEAVKVLRGKSIDLMEAAEGDTALFEGEAAAPEADESPASTDEAGHFTDKSLSILFIAGPPSVSSSYASTLNFHRCVRNIQGIDVIPVEELEAYEVLRRKWVVMDTAAVEWLGERAGDDLASEGEFEQYEAEIGAVNPAEQQSHVTV